MHQLFLTKHRIGWMLSILVLAGDTSKEHNKALSPFYLQFFKPAASSSSPMVPEAYTQVLSPPFKAAGRPPEVGVCSQVSAEGMFLLSPAAMFNLC